MLVEQQPDQQGLRVIVVRLGQLRYQKTVVVGHGLLLHQERITAATVGFNHDMLVEYLAQVF